jgi:F420-dependent oxidoreductase-like protein
MRLSIFLDPQEGMTWATIAAAAERTERGGFHGLYRSDHLAPTSGLMDRAATEAWSTLAGLARETTRIRLGTLITPLTFRDPSLLSKIVSTIDEMSDGRIDVSIGTGWNTREHQALGIPFASQAERFDRLEEYLQVLTGLWGDRPFDFQGRFYRVDSILPRPLPARRPPIIVGGHGRNRTPAIAARFADEYNIDWPTPERASDLYGRVDAACVKIGRDPSTLLHSALLGVILGSSAKDVARRAAIAVRELGGSEPDAWLAEHEAWRAGTPDEIASWLRGYGAAGVRHAQLMLLPSIYLDTIDLLARDVLPALDGAP